MLSRRWWQRVLRGIVKRAPIENQRRRLGRGYVPAFDLLESRELLNATNPDTKRGLIREKILPLLQQLHPAARENLLRVLDERQTLTPELASLLAAPVASRRVDLGGGVQAVREHDRLWLERGPVALRGSVDWGTWRIESELPGLTVRGWRAGDRLAGRKKKVQDVFVDAKIPRSDREGWPLVVRGDEVVAVPGIVEAEGVTATRVAD